MLVEVLAALLVTAALVAVVLPFAGTLIGRWQAGQASILQADAWMQALARLGDDVAEALPIREPGGPPGALAVEPRKVSFIRPGLGAPDTLERVTYGVETTASGERLVRRARGLGDADPPKSSTTTLLEGPYTLRFAVVGPDGARATRWTEGTAMPLRLELAAAGPKGSRAPFSPVSLPIAARVAAATVVPMLRTTAP